MKTKEKLNTLKEEVKTLNEKLHELTPEELEQVSGGVFPGPDEHFIEHALLTPGLGTPAILEESINGISDIDAADLVIRQTTFSNKDILSLSPSSGIISKTLSDQL